MSEQSDNKLYAVYRNGYRVSDAVYPSPSFATKELEHWLNIVQKFPDGSKVEVKLIKNEN